VFSLLFFAIKSSLEIY